MQTDFTIDLKTKLKSVTNGRKYITSILRNYKEDEKVTHSEVLELIKFHPIKKIEKTKIEYLIMRKRKPYNNLALFYKYKTSSKEDDISYISCLENLFGKYKPDKDHLRDVEKALRSEVHDGTKKQFWLSKQNSKCENCNSRSSSKMAVDHYPISFKEIWNLFFLEAKIDISTLQISENKTDNTLILVDREIAAKWLAFHDERAKYRILCQSCNSSFGCYGYEK